VEIFTVTDDPAEVVRVVKSAAEGRE